LKDAKYFVSTLEETGGDEDKAVDMYKRLEHDNGKTTASTMVAR
jgi:hypothetical protein